MRTNASQVNSHWQTSRKPLVYRDIEISYVLQMNNMMEMVYRNVPSVAVMEAHSQYIRSLAIIGKPRNQEAIEIFDIQCSGLETFIWRPDHSDNSRVSKNLWSPMIEFLTDNQSELRSITIGYQYANPMEFWKTLAAEPFPMLKSISIKNTYTTVDAETGIMICEACRGLESLELDIRGEVAQSVMSVKSDMDTANARTQELRGPSVPKRRATENLGEKFLFPRLSMMKQCPSLELIQIGDNEGLLLELLEATSTAEIWPNLNSMELAWPAMTDRRVAELVLSINRSFYQGQGSELFQGKERLLESFQSSAKVGSLSIHALESYGHLAALEFLDISSTYTRSVSILVVLTSCPRLKSLKAVKVHAADIQREINQPWVCLCLESWNDGLEMGLSDWRRPAGITSDPTMEELQEACFEQIGRLSELRTLELCGQGQNRVAMGIRLKLESGLGRLSRLQGLKKLAIEAVQMGNDDVAWMSVNWTKVVELHFDSDIIWLDNRDHSGMSWQAWLKFF
ncbi:hypothetical protein BGX27_001166 [Mortierella sp. AM989]|nr:hypothetical protein BGX27_001166 [Mortierella sp. AM989]